MILESKTGQTALLFVSGMLVGLLLMLGFRDFHLLWSNELAGFLLGCMVFGLSLIALVMGESRRVELDEAGRQVVLAVSPRWGGEKRIVMPFTEIKTFSVGVQGDSDGGSRYYDLVVHLQDGREIYLLGGCVFEGRMSRDWMEDLRARFEQALRTTT